MSHVYICHINLVIVTKKINNNSVMFPAQTGKSGDVVRGGYY